MESLNLGIVEKRYGKNYVEDIWFARKIALEIDRNPLSIDKFKNESTIVKLSLDRDNSSLDRTIMTEAIAYGDASVYLACPNPSLAGGLIKVVADNEHKDYFFDFIKKERCTTFTGITEPQHGSDIASLKSKLEKIDEENYCLSGEKCFITHGFDGKIAVVVARTSPGPLGITPVMITYEDFLRGEQEGTIHRELLPIVGLKGTCLSRLSFNKFVISYWNILGQQLHPAHRGMFAVMKTFNLMRPSVAAFIIGQTQGIVDYIRFSCKVVANKLQTTLDRLDLEIACARANLYRASKLIDENPLDASYVSMVKAQTTELAERTATVLLDEFDASIFYEHPLLLKWFRDIYAFEYMEGTTDMQKRNVYGKYLKI